MPSIKLVNVTKKYSGITAVKDVNLTIADGEYVCILGPTGSGKTTLLKIIAGVVRPDRGEIYIDGNLVNDIPPQERNVAYVPQHYALFPHLSVLENVIFGPISRGLSKEEAYEASMRMLEMTRLAWRANSFPHELSGGMQQRLALARALASGAKILLLDEPLGALDARLRVELRYKLREIARENNLTTIHVTHDQEEAMIVADRIVVLRGGEIVQEGTPLQIYSEPKNIFVAHFIGGANFFEGFIVDFDRHGSWIQLRNGFLLRTKSVNRSIGEKVVAMVREERIEIMKAAKKREEINLFPGTIVDISFLGDFLFYTVLLDNGDRVGVKVPTITALGKFKVKERVYLRLKSEDIVIYPYPPHGLYRELEVI